jgi:hypothetical protein
MRPLLILLLGAAAATASPSALSDLAPSAILLEDWAGGFDQRWFHSAHEKYTGKFRVTKDQQLQVGTA